MIIMNRASSSIKIALSNVERMAQSSHHPKEITCGVWPEFHSDWKIYWVRYWNLHHCQDLLYRQSPSLTRMAPRNPWESESRGTLWQNGKFEKRWTKKGALHNSFGAQLVLNRVRVLNTMNIEDPPELSDHVSVQLKRERELQKSPYLIIEGFLETKPNFFSNLCFLSLMGQTSRNIP